MGRIGRQTNKQTNGQGRKTDMTDRLTGKEKRQTCRVEKQGDRHSYGQIDSQRQIVKEGKQTDG